ncbi:hypothetical protein B0H17DRAFT_469065 [Mycena rosella]|uniref:Uncharacterized protein n=1 Tax=Mycena rosella TaxID=1033263 RepID=A0AAD7C8D1_MYCRO|nr:hypothetical protein B0H17DRAFT_469065 [Mycena rosella]
MEGTGADAGRGEAAVGLAGEPRFSRSRNTSVSTEVLLGAAMGAVTMGCPLQLPLRAGVKIVESALDRAAPVLCFIEVCMWMGETGRRAGGPWEWAVGGCRDCAARARSSHGRLRPRRCR